MPLLAIENLRKRFGGVLAVDGVSFAVDEGSVVGLIGPNGAGKTALINLVTGFYRGGEGSILLDGRQLLNRPVHVVARQGVARTFQNIRLFGRLTVLENVLVARRAGGRYGLRSLLGRTSRSDRAAAWSLLRMAGLESKADTAASALAYGDARRLEIARALAGEPRLLVMDEPAAGMNEWESEALTRVIAGLRGRVSAILLIEHDIALVRALCDRLVVMENGRLIAHGGVEEVLASRAVRQAYLGDGDSDGGDA